MKRAFVTRVIDGEEKPDPIEVSFEKGTITFPRWGSVFGRLNAWRVYLPKHGFEPVGPFYWWTDVTEGLADSLSGRTLEVKYLDSQLRNLLPPTHRSTATEFMVRQEQIRAYRAARLSERHRTVELPPLTEGQRGWALHAPGNPEPFAVFIRCDLCGDLHEGSVTFGGVPLLACPEVPRETPLMSVDFGKALIGLPFNISDFPARQVTALSETSRGARSFIIDGSLYEFSAEYGPVRVHRGKIDKMFGAPVREAVKSWEPSDVVLHYDAQADTLFFKNLKLGVAHEHSLTAGVWSPPLYLGKETRLEVTVEDLPSGDNPGIQSPDMQFSTENYSGAMKCVPYVDSITARENARIFHAATGEAAPLAAAEGIDLAATWECSNHPPACPVPDIPSGEACPVCGRNQNG